MLFIKQTNTQIHTNTHTHSCHRYDGVPLWNVRDVPGVHELVWVINFISFWFLYPSTFNILEVRAFGS